MISSTDSNGPEDIFVCCECEQRGTWIIRNSVLRNMFIPKSNGCLGLASEDSILVFLAISQRKSYLEPVELVYFNYLTCVVLEFFLHWNLQISILFNNPVLIWHVTPIILCYSYTDPVCYSSDFYEIKFEDGTLGLK